MQKGDPIYRQQFLELICINLKRQDIKYSCIPTVMILHCTLFYNDITYLYLYVH